MPKRQKLNRALDCLDDCSTPQNFDANNLTLKTINCIQSVFQIGGCKNLISFQHKIGKKLMT